MKYQIFISNYARTKAYEFPILPENMPEKTVTADVTEFKTASNGTYAIIGERGLDNIEINQRLPGIGKKRTFYLSSTKGRQIIHLIQNAMKEKEPIRLTICRSNGTYFVNTTYAITSFMYHELRNSDFEITLSLLQWRDYGSKNKW